MFANALVRHYILDQDMLARPLSVNLSHQLRCSYLSKQLTRIHEWKHVFESLWCLQVVALLRCFLFHKSVWNLTESVQATFTASTAEKDKFGVQVLANCKLNMHHRWRNFFKPVNTIGVTKVKIVKPIAGRSHKNPPPMRFVPSSVIQLDLASRIHSEYFAYRS